MKCVLLLHPTLLFYKIPIYNKLSRELRSKGLHLIIWYTDIKKGKEIVEFEELSTPMSMRNYHTILKHHDVEVVINLLFKRTPGPLFYFFSVLSAKLKGIKTVYYGHGFNLEATGQWPKNIGNLTLLLFNKIILYSPDQKKLLWKVNRGKVSVAYNTLDLAGRRESITRNRDEILNELLINESCVVLFSGRIEPRKKLNILLEIFMNPTRTPKDTALLIVGPGLDDETQLIISKHRNIHYLGAIYDKSRMGEVFFASDIFCIPGHLGLGLVEALYWGLPVLSLNGSHAPEVFYLRDGENSYLVKTEEELEEKLGRLCSDEKNREMMSKNAEKLMKNQGSLEHMFSGFYQALGLEL